MKDPTLVDVHNLPNYRVRSDDSLRARRGVHHTSLVAVRQGSLQNSKQFYVLGSIRKDQKAALLVIEAKHEESTLQSKYAIATGDSRLCALKWKKYNTLSSHNARRPGGGAFGVHNTEPLHPRLASAELERYDNFLLTKGAL